MKIEDRTNYLLIELENESETEVLRKIFVDKVGEITMGVGFKGDILGLKVWKIKR